MTEPIFSPLMEVYPAELEIKVKNGQASTNVEEPYLIPFPTDLFPLEQLPPEVYSDVGGTRPPMSNLSRFNLLTIDTQAQVTDIGKYNTLAFLTKDSLAVVGEQGDIRVYPLREIKGD